MVANDVVIVDERDLRDQRRVRVSLTRTATYKVRDRIALLFPNKLKVFTVDCDTAFPGDRWSIKEDKSRISEFVDELLGSPWSQEIVGICGHYENKCENLYATVKSSKVSSEEVLEKIKSVVVEELKPLAQQLGKTLEITIEA